MVQHPTTPLPSLAALNRDSPLRGENEERAISRLPPEYSVLTTPPAR